MTKLVTPRLCLNGTPASRLYDSYSVARESLGAAVNALADVFNLRDYQVSTETYETARREHLARLKRIEEVQREVDEILNALEPFV